MSRYLFIVFTFTGYGTTHKVNNLIIQMNGNFSNVETSIDTSAIKGRRRSFNPSNIANRFEVTLGKRVDPEVLEFPENHEKKMLFADRERSNFIYSFMRFQSVPRQVVPNWIGFNIIVCDGLPVMKASVHYLDCIDNPATEMSTIYQVCSI